MYIQPDASRTWQPARKSGGICVACSPEWGMQASLDEEKEEDGEVC